MHTEAMRQKLFNIRFSDEEWARLGALTEHLGLNAANLVRMLLKEKARQLGLDAANDPPAKASPAAPRASSSARSSSSSSATSPRPKPARRR